VVAGLIKWWHD